MSTSSGRCGDAWPHAIAVAALLAVVGAVVITFFAVRAATGGPFLYVLDDPYIHLQLARTLALNGVYGLHPEEVSAPSSSVLWPLLLVPAARSAWFEFAPFGLALAAAAALPVIASLGIAGVVHARPWGLGLRRAVVAIMVATSLLAGNPIGLPFTGMEQSLQVLLATAAAVGLIRLVALGTLAPWFGAVLVIGPLIRFESASITLAACVVLFGLGRRRAALAIAASAAAALGVFVAFLLSRGLDPLPSSVIEKTFVESGWLVGRLFAHLEARWYLPMWLVLVLPIPAVLLLRRAMAVSRPGTVLLVVAAMLVVAAHVAGGRYHWGARYEVYVFAFALPLLTWCHLDTLPAPGAHRVATAALAGLALLLGGAYLRHGALAAPEQAVAIQAQPAQVARFVAEFWRAPVAVNDIGLVGLRSDVRVLDLVGLSSREIRRARSRGDAQAARAVDAAARRLGVKVALFYPHWVGAYRPAHWVPVAVLVTRTSARNLGGKEVAIQATDPADVPALTAALEAFARGLPPQTTLAWQKP